MARFDGEIQASASEEPLNLSAQRHERQIGGEEPVSTHGWDPVMEFRGVREGTALSSRTDTQLAGCVPGAADTSKKRGPHALPLKSVLSKTRSLREAQQGNSSAPSSSLPALSTSGTYILGQGTPSASPSASIKKTLSLRTTASIAKAASLISRLPVSERAPLTGGRSSLKFDLNGTPARLMVEKQASQQKEAGSLLNLVCECEESDENLQLLRDRIALESPVVDPETGFRKYPYPRDEAGASLLHLSVLNCKHRFAECFIQEFGEPLVNAQYRRDDGSPGLYDGETALHIAIVNRSHKMVRTLLNTGADTKLRAVGAFFRWSLK